MRDSEKVLIGKDKNEKEIGDDVRYNTIEDDKELSRVTLRYGTVRGFRRTVDGVTVTYDNTRTVRYRTVRYRLASTA